MYGSLMRHGCAKEPQDHCCRFVQQAYCRTRDADKGVHRPRNPQRHLIDLAPGERFRDLFSEKHFKVSDKSKGHRHGYYMRINVYMRKLRQAFTENGCDNRLADPAKGQAAEGYA